MTNNEQSSPDARRRDYASLLKGVLPNNEPCSSNSRRRDCLPTIVSFMTHVLMENELNSTTRCRDNSRW